MATYLGKKWQWKLWYTSTPSGLTTLTHELNLYVNITDGSAPGGDFSGFIVTRRDNTEVELDLYTDELMDLIEPTCPLTHQFVRAELWAANVASDDFIFYSVLPIGHAGSVSGSGTAYIAQIMTFRSQDGKSLRYQMAEPSLSAGPKDPYPFSSPTSAAIASHIAGVTSGVVNKFFSFPIAPINNCIEQHEHYWDARNR